LEEEEVRSELADGGIFFGWDVAFPFLCSSSVALALRQGLTTRAVLQTF
jgi:hypothetical protein